MKTLRLARKAQKITQGELADMLSEKIGKPVSQQQICNYETNYSLPPLDKLIALEEILEIDLIKEYHQLIKAGVREEMRIRFKNGRKATTITYA